MPKKDIVSMVAKENRQCVMLTITEDCNLRCRYCYEENKTHNKVMNIETAKQVVTQYMQTKSDLNAIEFEFFGGEPLLNFALIRELVDWFHLSSWNKKHLFFIATNGTILTPEIKTWLLENKECVWVGVSLDGNKTAHDINRSNSYDQVFENLPFFLQNWPDQPVKMTISAETIPHLANSIIDLEEKNIPFSSNLVFENIWGDFDHKQKLLNIYSDQLEMLVNYYVERPNLFPAFILSFKPEEIFHLEQSLNSKIDYLRWCGAGHEMVAINTDGSYAPCHRFSEWITGKPVPIGNSCNRQTTWKPEKCASCQLLNVCPTCAGFNWQDNNDSAIRSTYHCEAFKLQVQAAAKLCALRLIKYGPGDMPNLTNSDKYLLVQRIDSLLEISENEMQF
jgi:radical SAM protein with 4Fe4S-binding SPASM domain